MELLTVIFWINPFFHLIKKEVKAIHEFLADQFAITENTKWQYAELLLMQVLNTNQHLVNPFFHNQIKRRIAMITTSKKPSYQYLRKLMVLPVAAIVIGLFAFSYKQKKDNEASSGNSGSLDKTQLDDTTKLYPDTNILIKKTYPSPPKKSPSQEQLNIWQDSKNYGVWFDDHRIKNIELRKYKPSDFVLYNVSKLEKNATNYGKHYYQVTLLSAKHYAQSFPGDSQTYYMRRVEKTDTTKPFYIIDNKIFDKVDIEASFPGGDPKWRQYVAYNMGKGNFNFDKTAPEGTYTTVVIFIVDKDGHISDVKALTAHGYGMEEEAIRMIKNGPKWNPAVQNGKQVKAYRRQPITFVVTKGQTNFSHNAKTTSNDSNIVFEKVETEASFPGGELKWRQYLERNAKGSIALDKGAPKGTYTVIVQFIVDKEGNISDIRALTNHGFGMENEAVRVIKSGPKWNSAIQNGKQVKAYKRQPITFVVRSEKTDDKIFDKRDTPASFPGGDPAWKSYLEIMVNAHVPIDSGAPPAVYTAMVQFIVHEDGSLSDVKALTKHGYGMENEAMRVIKTGPKWIPAKQNGHIVRAYVQQPITFAIAEEDGASNQNSLQPTATTSPDIPKITVAELKKASVYKLLQLPEGTEIISFMFTMDTDGGDIIETPGNGSSFNYKIKNLINNAKPGKMITFDQIRIKKDGQEIKIPGKAYAVTN